MLDGLLTLLLRESSGRRALEAAEALFGLDRRPGVADARAALDFASERLAGAGLSVSFGEIPADGRTAVGDIVSPVLCEPRSALLEVTPPGGPTRTVADIRKNPLCLFPLSAATGPGGDGSPVEADLVAWDSLPDTGTDTGTDLDADTAAENLRGRIVLTGLPMDSRLERFLGAAGALGVLHDASGGDAVAERRETGGAAARAVRREDAAFFPDNAHRLFGFSLSAEQSRQLRRDLSAAEASGKPVRVRAAVSTRLSAGKRGYVSGALTGSEPAEPEVLIFAALHRPGAVDNAAGAAAVLEAAETLAALVAAGRLPRPRRTVRFLLGPRTSAPVAFALTRLGKTGADGPPIAGLSVRGVGRDDSIRPLTYARSAEATCPSADVALEAILAHPALHRHAPAAVASLSAGGFAVRPADYRPEDSPLSDPAFGVAFPVLTQEHPAESAADVAGTSLDTPDALDPDALGRAAAAVAATAMFLADAGSTEAAWMAEQVFARTQIAIAETVRRTDERLLGLLGRLHSVGREYREPKEPREPREPREREREGIRLHEPRRRAGKRLLYLRDRCFDALTALGAFAAPRAEGRDGRKRSATADSRASRVIKVEEPVGDPFRWTVNDLAGRIGREVREAADHLARTVDLEVARLSLARRQSPADMGIVADLPVLERFQEHLAGQLIPKRTVPGPLTLDGIPPAEAERLGLPLGRGGPALGDELTWVDGKRSIRDIHRLLALQHDRADLGRLMELFPALAASGLVELSTRGAPEFDREHLLADLRRLGVREGAPLLVHSSMRALGYIMGGAVAALEALLEAVGERGTLVMPTFTHPSELFLPDYTPCYTGTLPEFLRHRSDALRSVHPEYSVVAMGPDAAHLVDGHRRAGAVHSGLGLDSPLHRLARKGGWVLLLGVGHDRNSMIHVGEAVAGAPYLGLADTLLEGRRLRSRFPDGSVVGFEPQQTCSRNFEALHRPLAAAGLVREGPVGSARARLMRAEDVIATVREVLAADPAFLLCDTAACTFCHRARVAALKPRAGLAATPSVSRPAVPEPVASGGRR